MATSVDPTTGLPTTPALPPDAATYTPQAVPPASATPQGGLLGQTVGTVTNPQPPIDPNVYENDNVTNILNSITSQDSPYMQQAQTAGLQTANRRGLLNSSIAAGASESSALQAAAPLAVQQAQIAASRNLARVNAYFTGQQQQAELTARQSMLTQQLTSEQQMQAADIANKLQMQGIDITNQQQMQQTQLAMQQKLAEENIASQERMLGRQLTAQEQQQQRDIAAQQARLAMSLASQEKQTTQTLTSQQNIAQLQAKTQTQIAATQNATDQQKAALAYYAQEDAIYAQGVDALWQNADLPAPARDQAIGQLTAMKNSGVDLPAAIMGIQLTWPTTSTGNTAGGPAPLPPPPPTPTTSTTGTYTPTGPLPTQQQLAAMQNDGIPGNYAYYNSLLNPTQQSA